MGKQKKKGKAGQAKNYITRTQAVRKLQISLPDFRRLCIFKGIYPREPRNIKKANKSATHSTTFYYTKDIQYLLHEPLLGKFREQKTLDKKIARSLGRNEVQDAVRLERQAMPKIKLDHIVKERYPTFVDALRDLDDALSLLFLFANLPSTTTVPPKVIAKCQRLSHEFEHYLIATNSLRKSFLSIKGIYYQATIQGQDIMWLVPYKFVQRVTQDVDYRIMGTFVEFYCTLLGFVNFRLYTSIGLVYPPKYDAASDERGAELAAFTLEGRGVTGLQEPEDDQKTLTNGHAQSGNSEALQAQIDKISKESVNEDDIKPSEDVEEPADDGAIDEFTVAAPEGDVLPQPDLTSDQAASLFSNLTVFISREAPRHPVELLLRAFGCKRIAWDTVLGDGAFTNDETDPRITHQIVDRPIPAQALSTVQGDDAASDQNLKVVKPGHIIPGRTYVQPQWAWDCINEGKLLRTDVYAPGATLPPHLSPWMKPTSGQYDPRATLEEQQPEGEADDAADEVDEDDEEDDVELDEIEGEEDEESEADEVDAGDMDLASSGDDDDSSEEEDEEQDGFGGFEDGLDAGGMSDDLDEEAQHQKELEAEALGRPVSATQTNPQVKQKAKAKKERQTKKTKKEEEVERQKMMMSNKKRKLYEKMQFGNNKRDVEAEKLRGKRRKLEKVGKDGR